MPLQQGFQSLIEDTNQRFGLSNTDFVDIEKGLLPTVVGYVIITLVQYVHQYFFYRRPDLLEIYGIRSKGHLGPIK